MIFKSVEFYFIFAHRNQGPTLESVNILEQIGDILAKQHLSKRQVRMELLLTVQDLVNNTFKEDVNADVSSLACN